MSIVNPSPETTLVVILGASGWPKSPDLASSEVFKKSARGLKKYLLSPAGFSLPGRNLLDLFDSEQAPSELDEQIGNFLQERTLSLKAEDSSVRDVVIYYVGHGGFAGHNNDYFLAVRATRKDNPLVSGVLVAGLAKTLKEKGRGLRKYIVLDACFSASAYETFQSAPMEVAKHKAQEAFRKGTAFLCSSGARDPSKLPPGEQYTMFTGALLQVLREGSLEKQDRLSLAEVGEMAKEFIFDKYQDEAVRPQVMAPSQEQGDVGILPFFPNPAIQEKALFDKVNDLEDIVKVIQGSTLPNIQSKLQKLDKRIDSFCQKAELVSKDEGGTERPRYYRYGLTRNQWESLPGNIKLEIDRYRKERLIGLSWLTVCLCLCYGLIVSMFVDVFYLRPILPTCILFSLFSIVVLLWDAKFKHVIQYVTTTERKIWDDWEIVAKAKSRDSLKLFRSLNIWSSPFVGSTALYVLVVLIWFAARYFHYFR